MFVDHAGACSRAAPGSPIASGIHSVFGAFVLGAAMPRGVLSRDLQRLIEPLTTALFVPLFFVYSGLNTRIGLIDSPRSG